MLRHCMSCSSPLYKLRKKMLEFAESQGFTIRGDKFVYKED